MPRLRDMPKPRKANKAEGAVEEQPKEEPQVCAVTPRPKGRDRVEAHLQFNEAKKGGKGGKGKRSESEPRPEKRKQQCIPFYRGICKKGGRSL